MHLYTKEKIIGTFSESINQNVKSEQINANKILPR